jgi:hypothetical protein
METIDLRLSDGDLVYSHANKSIRTNVGKTRGKWYWEVKLNSGSPAFYLGIANSSYPIGSSQNLNQNWRVAYGSNGYKYPANVSYGPAWVISDVIGINLDLDIGTLSFTRNGVDLGIAFSDIKALGEVYPVIGAGGGEVRSAFINFGYTPFVYPMPIGYYAYGSAYSHKFLISSGDVFYSNKLVETQTKLVPPMTSNILPSGVASASTIGTGHEAYKAFDGLTTTYWSSSNAAIASTWLRYDFPSPVAVNRYILRGYKQLAQNPSAWTFEGSNDGTSWTVLDTRAGINDWDKIEVKQFNVPYNISYSKYRVVFTAINASSLYYMMQEFELVWYTESRILIDVGENDDQTFLNHGLDKFSTINLNDSYSSREFIRKDDITLGSGKVFKKTIDTSKVPIKKVTIT